MEEWKEEIVGAVGVVGVVQETEMRIGGIRGGCRISARHRVVGLEYWTRGRDCQIGPQRNAWLCMMEELFLLHSLRRIEVCWRAGFMRKRRINCKDGYWSL